MIAALVAVLAASSAQPVVSVLYFENRTADPAYDELRKGLAEMMVTDLVSWNGVTVVERARLEAVLGELKLQASKAFDQSTRLKVGKLLNAQYLIVGSLFTDGPTTLRVDAELVSVEAGTVVAVARAADQRDRIFDLEQRLVAQLTQQIDLKVGSGAARRKAFVPNMSVLLAYGHGLELADQGKLADADQALSALLSKNPLVSMARETRGAILKRLEASKTKTVDLRDASTEELARRADALLPTFTANDRSRRLAWRMVRSICLQRALTKLASSRQPRDRVVLPGNEKAALAVLVALVDNEQAIMTEFFSAGDSFEPAFDDPTAELLVRDARMSTDGRLSLNESTSVMRLGALLVDGRSVEADGATVLPSLGALQPKRVDDFLALLDGRIAERRNLWLRQPPDVKRTSLEGELTRLRLEKASLLESLEREEAAALTYQAILDDFPATKNDFVERRIKIIAGVEEDDAHRTRERWRKGLQTCAEMDLRVGFRSTRTFDRLGLARVELLLKEVEAPCLGRPGLDSLWESLYGSLASFAAEHGDCARARSLLLKQFAWGAGPRSMGPASERMPWCELHFSEDTLPSKVRITGVNMAVPDERERAALKALPELLQEELGARGVAIESGGASHGGVAGLYLGVEQHRITLRSEAVDTSHPIAAALDVDALLAPVLKAMRPGADVGPRRASKTLPFDFVVAYGRALDLRGAEAHEAFERLSKEYPQFRMAALRARMTGAD